MERVLALLGALMVGAALVIGLADADAGTEDGGPDRRALGGQSQQAHGEPASPASSSPSPRPSPADVAAPQTPTSSDPTKRERSRPRSRKALRPLDRGAVPRAVVIRSLGVRARTTRAHVNDGVLLPPDDPTKVGWWRGGARPGAARGSAVITGHTVSTGGGAFDDLDRMRPGQRVEIVTPRGRLQYRVEKVETYRKRSLARHAQRVFSQSVPGRLVLVTCEDWNGEVYLSNEVVFARQMGVRARS